MGNRVKSGLGTTPHPLGRRVWRDEFRVAALQLPQAVHQTIIFSIRNRRIIENVVAIVVFMNLFTQHLHFLAYFSANWVHGPKVSYTGAASCWRRSNSRMRWRQCSMVCWVKTLPRSSFKSP